MIYVATHKIRTSGWAEGRRRPCYETPCCSRSQAAYVHEPLGSNQFISILQLSVRDELFRERPRGHKWSSPKRRRKSSAAPAAGSASAGAWQASSAINAFFDTLDELSKRAERNREKLDLMEEAALYLEVGSVGRLGADRGLLVKQWHGCGLVPGEGNLY